MKHPKFNILVAYPYLNNSTVNALTKFDAEHPDTLRFFLDSGAFTAFNSGKPIALDDYCKFLEGLPFKPWRYFLLDVIGDEHATKKNYEVMLERGFDPVPIFTFGQDWNDIDHYYKHTDFIAYGGLVGRPKNEVVIAVDKFMKICNDRKSHLLGFTRPEHLKHFKPYSCDSSSWSGALRFAAVKLYEGNGQWVAVNKKTFQTKPDERVLRIINSYGIDAARLSKAEEWKNSGSGKYALETLTYQSWTRYMLDIEKNIDTKLFLACASDFQINLMAESFNYWIEKRG